MIVEMFPKILYYSLYKYCRQLPVSYTHLDVYKRQTSSGSKYTWTVNNGRIGWAASESLLVENTNQKGTNYKWEMCKAGNIPVSYTHLDVYKRQSWYRPQEVI